MRRPEQHLSDYPLWSRVEWHLARLRSLSWLVGLTCHVPLWYRWHWKWRASRMPQSLSNFARVGFSQNGEEGMIDEVFRRIGAGNKYAVEFGISTGEECCTRSLFAKHGWGGLVMDGSEKNAARARELFSGLPVRIGCHFVTRANITSLLEGHGVPDAPDLLVVDIDGNDYWVLAAALARYSPRVVVVEYNGSWPPPMEWVMSYSADHRWDGTRFYGASLTSLAKLCGAHDYALVGCDPNGVNAFFVRNDQLDDHFPDCNKPAHHHYPPPRYGRMSFGHPVRR